MQELWQRKVLRRDLKETMPVVDRNHAMLCQTLPRVRHSMGQLGQQLLWDGAGWPEVHGDTLDGFAAIHRVG